MKLKNIREVKSRGVLFTYEFDDSVYLINTKNKLFLCDTSESYDAMEYIKEYIDKHHLSMKSLIIFNSHSDWDHVWGNGAYSNPSIISHRTCRKRLIRNR